MKINANLKKGGQLLLAIENRYDYAQFFGVRDPHTNLLLTSFLPRFMSNIISNLFLKRPYVNYLYSFREIKKMLMDTGFKNVELYMAFPHYHAPELLLPYEGGITRYRKYWAYKNLSFKQSLLHLVQYIMMKYFRLRFFAPSIIAIAKK